MVQRLAWPLHKDDTEIREVFHIKNKNNTWETEHGKSLVCLAAVESC